MKIRSAILSAIPAAAALLASVPAHALTIGATFGVGVSAAAQTAFNFAKTEFENLYSDAITINIAVAAGNTGLGGSSTNLQFNTYGQFNTALTGDSKSANDAIAVANLPGASPFPASQGFLLSFAEAKAIGLRGANDAATDGTFTFNSTLAYTFNPLNRQVPGQFDFIGVAEHEISEIMGRIPGLNTPGFPFFLGYDVFRFKGNGVRSFTDEAGAYFSINNGATNLKGFNFAHGNGSDPQDWDASDPTDPFDAFTGSGQGHAISAVDVVAMDVLGYDLKAAVVPEPETYALMLAGLGVLGATARRRLNARRD